MKDDDFITDGRTLYFKRSIIHHEGRGKKKKADITGALQRVQHKELLVGESIFEEISI